MTSVTIVVARLTLLCITIMVVSSRTTRPTLRLKQHLGTVARCTAGVPRTDASEARIVAGKATMEHFRQVHPSWTFANALVVQQNLSGVAADAGRRRSRTVFAHGATFLASVRAVLRVESFGAVWYALLVVQRESWRTFCTRRVVRALLAL